uniref:flagellar hook protein FlgE n=1 Tax=Agathobacter sp. TaxID=2021311 RepID=UPI00405789B9
MMRSMYSAVSGLKTHQTRMDVIGNNIANVNTEAFKASRVTFSEIIYQTTAKASGGNGATGVGGINAKQIGLGVTAGATSVSITTAGAAETTGNPFDLKLTDSQTTNFFIVSDGTNTFFTRSGSYYVDGNGYLCMSSTGYTLMGWQVDPATGEIKKDTVSPLQVMSPANQTSAPEATTKGYVSGILDKNDSNVKSEDGYAMTLGFFDDLGYAYTAKFSVKNVNTGDAGADEGKYTVTLDSIVDQYGNDVIAAANAGNNANNPITTDRLFSTGNIHYAMDADGNQKYVDANGNVLTYNAAGDYYYYLDANGAEVQATPESPIYEDEAGNELTAFTVDDANPCYYYNEKGEKVIVDINDPNIVQDGENYYYGNSPVYELEAGDYYYYTATETDDAGNTVEKQIISEPFTEPYELVFDTNDGTFVSIGGADSVTLNLSLILSNYENADGTTSNFKDIEVDFSSCLNLNNGGTSTMKSLKGDTTGDGVGRKLGALTGVSVDNTGKIYGSYDNGNTVLLGQISVAQFANASGLEKIGDNCYQTTLNSGDFDGIGVDISADGSSISTGQLEMSNVDLSAQFTDMIVTQRGFQANSRVITTSDSLLEELINLKR